MKNFLEAISNWNAEEEFKSYGLVHSCFFFGGIALVLWLAFVLRTKNERKARTVFLCGGIILLLTELVKQGMMTVKNGGEYDWYFFPFQLCSLPLYFSMIAAGLKTKHSKYFLMFMQTYSFLGGFFTLVYPPGILVKSIFLSLHSLLWHLILMFFGFYVCTCGLGIKNNKDFLFTALLFLLTALLATVLNVIIEAVVHYPIMFFMINPNHNSTMPILDKIQPTAGWFAVFLIYLIVFTALSYGVYRLQRLFYMKKVKAVQPA